MKNRKINILHLFLLMWYPCVLTAQVCTPESYEDLPRLSPKQSAIGMEQDAFFYSNSLNTSFAYNILMDKYLTKEIKETVNLDKQNYGLMQANSTLYFNRKTQKLFGIDGLGYSFRVSHKEHLFTNFTDDLFILGFFGNKTLAGKEAVLTNFNYTQMSYQDITAGLFKNFDMDGNTLTCYLGGSFIKGQKNNLIVFNETTFYTAPTGTSVDLSASATYKTTDTTRVKLYDFNGMGGSLDMYFSYHNYAKDYRIDLSITDAGFITWNDNAFTLPVDTTIHFEGKEIEDLFNITDIGDDLNEDSIVTDIFSKADTGNYNMMLPACFHLSYSGNLFGERFRTTFGMNYIYGIRMRFPYTYLKGYYAFNEVFSAGSQIFYGLYNNIGMGIGCRANYRDIYRIHFEIKNIAGMLVPKSACNQNLFVSLSVNI